MPRDASAASPEPHRSRQVLGPRTMSPSGERVLCLAVAVVMSSRALSVRGAGVVFVSGMVVGLAGGYLSAPMFPVPPLAKFSAAPPDGKPSDLTLADQPQRPSTQDISQKTLAHPGEKTEDVSAPGQPPSEGRDQTADAKAKTVVEAPQKTTPNDDRTSTDTPEASGTKPLSETPVRPNLARADRDQDRRRHRNDQRRFADAPEDDPAPRGRRSGRDRDREPSPKPREIGSGCFLFFCSFAAAAHLEPRTSSLSLASHNQWARTSPAARP
jgi:hypothetical protein